MYNPEVLGSNPRGSPLKKPMDLGKTRTGGSSHRRRSVVSIPDFTSKRECADVRRRFWGCHEASDLRFFHLAGVRSLDARAFEVLVDNEAMFEGCSGRFRARRDLRGRFLGSIMTGLVIYLLTLAIAPETGELGSPSNPKATTPETFG